MKRQTKGIKGLQNIAIKVVPDGERKAEQMVAMPQSDTDSESKLTKVVEFDDESGRKQYQMQDKVQLLRLAGPH